MSGTVRLPAWQADWLLRGALAAASSDDVTPILCAVKWAIADGRVTVIATDRYRVHQLYVPAPKGTPEGVFVMDHHQAELLTRWRHGSARARGSEVVDLTWVDAEPMPAGTVGKESRALRYHGTIRFDLWEDAGPEAARMSYEAAQVRGNYPPLEKLFDDAEEGSEERATELLLSPELLSSTRHLRADRGAPLRFIMPRTSERDTRATGGAKNRPLLVVNHEGTARALIQPNLMMHGAKGYGA